MAASASSSVQPRSTTFKAIASTVTLATALGLASCSSDSAPDTPPVEQAVGLAVDAPRVVVLDKGTGELRRLQYKDISEEKDAPKQEVTINISDGFAQNIADAASVDPIAPAGGDVSTMYLPVKASTTAAEASEEETVEATREISMVLGRPISSDTSQAADINTAEGFTLGMRATDSGQHTTVSFAAPVDANEEARMLLEKNLLTFTSLPVVFPQEEIGEGAKWTVDSRVTGESTLLQTVTFTVRSINGDKVDLGVEVSQRPSLGALDISAGSADATAQEDGEEAAGTADEQLTVLNSNTTSQGQLSVDLTQPLPTAGEVAWTTRVIYGGSNEQVRVVQDSTSAISFGDNESQMKK